MKKLLLLSALFIFACTDDEGNPCVYEPTLTTEAVTDITETSATLNGVISIVSENCEVPNNTEQGFVYSTEIQPTLEDIQVNVNGTNISTTIEGLTPNTTYYVRAFLTNTLGDFYGDEVSFSTNEVPCDVVYLAENGVTIKAYPCANIGDVGVINGVEYIVVDWNLLREMIANNEDVTKVATTIITDMSGNLIPYTSFNQPIGNWDVSNVTDMSGLFQLQSVFNQPLENWDTSSVIDMSYMFSLVDTFNQPLENWNVGNVTNMGDMFNRAYAFNQPIGNWDVSSVTDMNGMFSTNQSFNQPIGDWDVSSVTDMNGMFEAATSFNQPIGDWNISNVTNMQGMFGAADTFNQPLENWDVSSVTNMSYMFTLVDTFNQPLENWDVSSVTNMVGMFYYNEAFNQDLSNWIVFNTTECTNFSDNTPQWTLPQPNFTNCTP